jgi:hypothetical protein
MAASVQAPLQGVSRAAHSESGRQVINEAQRQVA